MDIAERWLRKNDPEYETTKKKWTQTGNVRAVEIPSGLLRGERSVVSEDRICEGCLEPFTPERIGHKYCSKRCEKRVNRRMSLETSYSRD